MSVDGVEADQILYLRAGGLTLSEAKELKLRDSGPYGLNRRSPTVSVCSRRRAYFLCVYCGPLRSSIYFKKTIFFVITVVPALKR